MRQLFDNYRALLRRFGSNEDRVRPPLIQKTKQPSQPGGAATDSVRPYARKTVNLTKLQDAIKFHKQSVDATKWLARVVRLLWRVQPRTTILTIGAAVLARFTNLAAFLIPLKVLLLAGSDGTPRYFSGFANPDTKLYWIVGLSFVAVALYFVTRSLESFAKNLSEKGSLEVMKQANQLALFGNQGDIGRRHFTKITDLCANFIFFTLAIVIISIVNLPLAVGVLVILAIQYGITSLLAHPRIAPDPIAKLLFAHPDQYIDELYIISFWLVFILILAPFVAGAGGNILLAIVSFLLIRQALSALSKVISSAVNLVSQRSVIDALISPSHQWQRSDSRTRKTFRNDFEGFRILFKKRPHLAKLEAVLASHFKQPRPTDIRWKDSNISGLTTFTLTIRSDGAERHYQEQIFAPHQAHLLQNEEILFQHVHRDALGAPAVLENFTYGAYQCRLCDYGLGTPAAARGWFERLLQRMWAVQPPDELVLAFRTSHDFIYNRLAPEFVRRLELAITTKNEAKTLRSFEARLPDIRLALSELPLYVSARDIVRSNTSIGEDSEPIVMMWGRWTLEPIGSSLPSRIGDDKLSKMLERARHGRSDISDTLSPDHLRLAVACQALEKKITEVKYAAGLQLLPTILHYCALVREKVDAPAETKPPASQALAVDFVQR